MENYTENPLDSNNQAENGVFKKAIWPLLFLVLVGGFLLLIGSYAVDRTAQTSERGTFSPYDSSFSSLEEVGINTNLSGVSGIPDTASGTETRDFRKAASTDFYEQRASEALERGLVQDWANSQLEVSAAYITQGGGSQARQAADALKSVIANRDVAQETRAKAMRSLAGLFCRSGLNRSVFDDIYTGPYAQFYEEGDPMLAGRRVMETSYEMFPRARTAVSIAHMYVDPIVNADLTNKEKEDARDTGLAFLRNAEVLARDTYNPREISGEYASYLFWRAVSYGQISMAFSSYVNEAEEAYADLFNYLDGYTGTFTTTVTDIIPFAHLRYVNFLTEIYGNDVTDQIRENLDTLVVLVGNDPEPRLNVFLKYLDNKRTNFENDGVYTHWLSDTRGYSANYDALLDSYGLPDQSSKTAVNNL